MDSMFGYTYRKTKILEQSVGTVFNTQVKAATDYCSVLRKMSPTVLQKTDGEGRDKTVVCCKASASWNGFLSIEHASIIKSYQLKNTWKFQKKWIKYYTRLTYIHE